MSRSPTGLSERGETSKETRLSWAEKAREKLAAERRRDDGGVKDKRCIFHLIGVGEHVDVEAEQQRQRHSGLLVPLQALPLDAWDIISSFLNFREVQLLSSTCRLFWVELHRRGNIWRGQLEQFRQDMMNLRGDGQLLSTEFLTPVPCTVYERMKLEHKLYVMDARREWHFREQEKADRSNGIFSSPLIFTAGDKDAGDQDHFFLSDEEALPLSQIRVLRPAPRSASEPAYNSSTADVSQGNRNMSHPAASIYTPSEYLTICDNINHGDFTWSRNVVQDRTADEDELILFALQQTLRRAKRPPTRRSLGDGSSSSYHHMLRRFSGTLLAICRYEAEQIFNTSLRMHGIIDDFVIFDDSSWTGPRDSARPVPLLQTRYFIAPELCRDGRIGLIVVDPVRVLVVVGKECVTRDDPQWDEAYTTAVEVGRAPQGSGRNPQPSRRV
ncbi:uncharacterized protein Tco025E_07418 [Trypanosoma conorhini]|uniref:F-box domain-containing protein n=1 Tax=Trypanosoma conorhini TaxID=83891 RepID=A0A422NNX3_9TRYP|nr:uncharacterized protein Tco025E_07418 [Trypanosoma conorhini]RNF07198.1 hypothetical protein Tco025E_07418 [Trypanosoma conorhini]